MVPGLRLVQLKTYSPSNKHESGQSPFCRGTLSIQRKNTIHVTIHGRFRECLSGIGYTATMAIVGCQRVAGFCSPDPVAETWTKAGHRDIDSCDLPRLASISAQTCCEDVVRWTCRFLAAGQKRIPNMHMFQRRLAFFRGHLPCAPQRTPDLSAALYMYQLQMPWDPLSYLRFTTNTGPNGTSPKLRVSPSSTFEGTTGSPGLGEGHARTTRRARGLRLTWRAFAAYGRSLRRGRSLLTWPM